MTGSIRGRGKRGDSWELKFDIGRDEKAGKRITQFHTFRGTKKEAKVKLARASHGGEPGFLCSQVEHHGRRARSRPHRSVGSTRQSLAKDRRALPRIT